jgi:hypothetical protein
MRPLKPLYPSAGMMYRPELLTCPPGGALLVPCNYLAWDKTVQMLARVVSVASRPGRCPPATGVGSRRRRLAAEGPRLAPAGSPYGYDGVVHMGWWRQEAHATYGEIHAALASRVRISVAHGGSLSPQVSLPLLACHERQHRTRLAQLATPQGGLIVALDGLAPQGGEPPLWFLGALARGVTVRRGWLCPQEPPTFAAVLAPLQPLEGPLRAVLSDKPTGLGPAVAPVLPHSRHQFCPAHSLRHRAAPLAEAEAAFQGERRKTGREHGADVLRQEPRTALGPPGVGTVPGLVPRLLAQPPAPAAHRPPPRSPPPGPESAADEVIPQLAPPPAPGSPAKASRPCGSLGWRPTSGSSTGPV